MVVATPNDAAQAASDVPPAPAHKARTGSASEVNVGESFQFDAKPISPGARFKPNLFN